MRIGVDSTDITPRQPIELVGYGYFPHRQSESVESPLVATAMALEDNSGQKAVLCTVDIHSVDKYVVNSVREAVEEASEGYLEGGPVLVNASHTHSGPSGHAGFLGIGKHNSDYLEQTLIPNVTKSIVSAIDSISDGEIGIKRASSEGLNYNRTGAETIDRRITAIRADSEAMNAVIAHFACHPVIYGSSSSVISSDYPGAVRQTLRDGLQTDYQLWATGAAGDIDPAVNKDRKNKTTQADVVALGKAIGDQIIDIYPDINLGDDTLHASQTEIELPVDTAFELKPVHEIELYREARKLSKDHDLAQFRHFLEIAAPIINGTTTETISVPVTLIAIGKTVFAGLGVEIYSETGTAIEKEHPELEIVTMMTSNEHQGYVPPVHEYEDAAYAARSSAFFFRRKPLLPSSEEILRNNVNQAISNLVA